MFLSLCMAYEDMNLTSSFFDSTRKDNVVLFLCTNFSPALDCRKLNIWSILFAVPETRELTLFSEADLH